jgi:hypothetical protein
MQKKNHNLLTDNRSFENVAKIQELRNGSNALTKKLRED